MPQESLFRGRCQEIVGEGGGVLMTVFQGRCQEIGEGGGGQVKAGARLVCVSAGFKHSCLPGGEAAQNKLTN